MMMKVLSMRLTRAKAVGSALPTECQGIKVLGCPLGHDDFVPAHLESQDVAPAHPQSPRRPLSVGIALALCQCRGELFFAGGEARVGGQICSST